MVKESLKSKSGVPKSVYQHPDQPGEGAKKRAHLSPKLKVAATMGEFKRGTLRAGGSGKHVTNRRQAVAIALASARRSK